MKSYIAAHTYIYSKQSLLYVLFCLLFHPGATPSIHGVNLLRSSSTSGEGGVYGGTRPKKSLPMPVPYISIPKSRYSYGGSRGANKRVYKVNLLFGEVSIYRARRRRASLKPLLQGRNICLFSSSQVAGRNVPACSEYMSNPGGNSRAHKSAPVSSCEYPQRHYCFVVSVNTAPDGTENVPPIPIASTYIFACCSLFHRSTFRTCPPPCRRCTVFTIIGRYYNASRHGIVVQADAIEELLRNGSESREELARSRLFYITFLKPEVRGERNRERVPIGEAAGKSRFSMKQRRRQKEWLESR